jgi:hypothetical protein
MRYSLHRYIVAGCVLTACAPAAAQMPRGSNVNPDAGLVAEFTRKTDAYVKIRNDAASAAPDLKRTEKPGEIAVAEKSMAQIVRGARATARRGDLFTPATEAMFRRLLHSQLTKGGGEGADNKAIIKDDAPAPKEVPFKVNADYPKEAPLSTVPPDVLQALPKLPEDVQYRFVGKHLLLYDAKANLIIDFMLNAIP